MSHKRNLKLMLLGRPFETILSRLSSTEAATAHRPNSRVMLLPNDSVIASEIVSDSFLDIEAPEAAQFS